MKFKVGDYIIPKALKLDSRVELGSWCYYISGIEAGEYTLKTFLNNSSIIHSNNFRVEFVDYMFIQLSKVEILLYTNRSLEK